jgi:hypothetical protein
MARQRLLFLHRTSWIHPSIGLGDRNRGAKFVTLVELEGEYRTELIGELIYARVRLLTARLLRRRDPRVYARGAHNYQDALDDVLNDFIIDVLIGERQIDYVMLTATDLDDFDRIVRRQLRRYLARTRTRTVVDNLIDRALKALRAPPFEAHGTGDAERFTLASWAGRSDSAPTDAELRVAAALAQAIPKVPAQGEERAPKVYEAEALQALLVLLCQAVSGPIGRQDLQTFFGHLLTAWTPEFLGPGEEHEQPASSLTPIEEALVNETAARLASAMTREERLIFQCKFANLPDRQVAASLGLSRQSTVPRKHALFARIMTDLTDLERELQGAVLARMNVLLAMAGEDV